MGYVLLTYNDRTKERSRQEFTLKSHAMKRVAEQVMTLQITSWQLQKWSGPYQSGPNEFDAVALPVAQSENWGKDG